MLIKIVNIVNPFLYVRKTYSKPSIILLISSFKSKDNKTEKFGWSTSKESSNNTGSHSAILSL